VLSLVAHCILSASTSSAQEAYENGRYEQCVAELKEADGAPAHVYSGLCHYALGKPAEAARHFRRALKLDPTSALPPFSPPKLVAFFNELKGEHPPDLPHAEVLYEEGRFEDATKALTSVRTRPLDASLEVRARLLEGALKVAGSQLTQADVSFRAALALQPDAHFTFVASSDARARLETMRSAGRPPQALNARVLVPGILGGVLVATGGVFYALARQQTDALAMGDPTITTTQELARRNDAIRLEQTLGFALAGTGAVSLVTAALFWILDVPAPRLTLAVTTQGAGLVFSARLP
jgi:tetratricopeptide (TPR) repeat protein